MAPMAGGKKRKGSKGVGIDFKKVRHKVGRKLAPAQNATKVEFKSKAIVLPGQSVALEKDGLAVNQRNKTLKELFGQTTHYSERVRKHALIGMKDLFQRHPIELGANIISVIQKLAARFTDVDKTVREALFVLLRTALPTIPKVVIKPLIPTVMAHLGSAMTHMSGGIRLSAFSFLDLYFQHYPSLLVPSFTVQIFSYYQHFLGERGLSTDSMVLVLRSLTGFLSVLRVPPSTNLGLTHVWRQKYDIEKARKCSFDELRALHSYKSIVPDAVTSGTAESGGSERMSVCLSLIQVLLNCWSDCVPSVCSSPLPDAAALDCMVHMANAICILFEWLEGPSEAAEVYHLRVDLRNKFLTSFSSRFMAPFPVSAPSVQVSSKIEEGLCELNVSICKVMLHFLVPVDLDTSQFAAHILLSYYENALAGQLLPVLDYGTTSKIQKEVIEAQVHSLLSYVPATVGCVALLWKQRLLQTVTEIFVKCKPQSRVKLACLSAMSTVLLSGSHDTDPSVNAMYEHFSKAWLQSFPKFLWELKDEHPSCSKTVLEGMLLVGRSAAEGSSLAEEYRRLQPAMVPFFCTFFATKQGEVKCLYGPFVKLPKESQEIAVDLLYYFTEFQSGFLKALATCLLYISVDADVAERAVEVLQEVHSRGDISIATYLSFLFTLLTGSRPVKESAPPQESEKKLIRAVCRSLCRLGDSEVALELLATPMSQHLADSPEIVARFLRVIATLSHGRDGHFNLPRPLQDVLPQHAAQCLVSQLSAPAGEGRPVTALGYAIVLIYRSKQFGASLLGALSALLRSDIVHASAVVKTLTAILKQEGIAQNLSYADVNGLVNAVKEARPRSLPEHKELINQLIQPLEAMIEAAGLHSSA